MRLRTEQDFRSEEQHFALAHGRLNHGGRIFQVFLAPGPATAQGSGGIVPGNGPRTGPIGRLAWPMSLAISLIFGSCEFFAA